MAQYKYENPYEWLVEHIQAKATQGNTSYLVWVIEQLASKVDADDIQDLFEGDMAADGFFDVVK